MTATIRSEQPTWDDAIDVVEHIVDQLMDIVPSEDDGTDGVSLGFIQSGALIVLGALLAPPGVGNQSLHDLIVRGAAAADVFLDDDDQE